MKVIVFSGTSEGKEITRFLSSRHIETTTCVATEYGKEVMEELPCVNVHIGRLDYDKMLDFIENYDLIIDATHPYAVVVTENIKKAAKEKEIKYLRLLREDTDDNTEQEIHLNSVEEAVNYLKEHATDNSEKIFVSTGSKELDKYASIPDFQERLVARVLPVPESREKCDMLGLKNVIYDKGPFSLEQNIKAFSEYNATWLVTKSGGRAGGFDEKIEAAKKLSMHIIVIKRPEETGGLGIEDVKNQIIAIRELIKDEKD